MPIYDYKCKKCGEKFEEFRYSRDADKSKDIEVKCPKCGTPGPERLFSIPVKSTSTCGVEDYGPVRG